MSPIKKILLKYGITLSIGFIIAAIIAYTQELFQQDSLASTFHVLSDSFFAPGVLIAGIGALIFIDNQGGFDAISYGLKSFFDIFRKEKKNKYRTFYDYKVAKHETVLPFAFILISGILFLIISIVMYLLYAVYAGYFA